MADATWAIPLKLNNFNIVLALVGGFISIFGLVSYLLKEHYYLSEARELLSSAIASLHRPMHLSETSLRLLTPSPAT